MKRTPVKKKNKTIVSNRCGLKFNRRLLDLDGKSSAVAAASTSCLPVPLPIVQPSAQRYLKVAGEAFNVKIVQPAAALSSG
jgi:hypothetical protein